MRPNRYLAVLGKCGVAAALLLALPSTSHAGIISIGYTEAANAFSLHLTGDAIDASATSILSFGSDWNIVVTVQEVDAAVDTLNVSLSARHLTAPSADTFTNSLTVQGTGRGFPLLFLSYLQHNPGGQIFTGPYDFYAGDLEYGSTSQLALPSPGTVPNQITFWSLTLQGTHELPEPASLAWLSLGLAGLSSLFGRGRKRNAPTSSTG